MNVDLLIHSATQLVTCASAKGPKRRQAMTDVGLIVDGAVAVAAEEIVAVGTSADVCAAYTASDMIDAHGKVVCPGFVDPHTHVVFAGDRVAEFEQRLRGASYMAIMAAGGGIARTMESVRAATVAQLVAETRPRLNAMLALGTTTVEVKSGYGLSTPAELKMLQAVAELQLSHPSDLVPTFMGAHAIPPEYRGRTGDYVDLVIQDMLPAAADWHRTSVFAAQGRPLFCDVFCEANVFNREQSQRVLSAGLAHGLPAKIHADEFENLGGVETAVALNAISVDHLDVTPSAEIETLAGSDTVGVILPAVNFNLGSTHYANGRAIIDAGAALALSTDINPGSAPCPSMPLVMAIATRYQKLLPAEALNAGTINAAFAVGLGNLLGSIEVGKQADLLLIDAPDYRHLAYQFGGNLVERVVKKGQEVVYNKPNFRNVVS
jgi:imidazolonepropionase